MDYLQYYYLEKYLFTSVTKKFEKNGYLNSFDFFCIIIWKANRAKTKIAKIIERQMNRDEKLVSAVRRLTQSLSSQLPPKEKMRILIEKWKFRLPIASAILTVLYPDHYTVYDKRVCSLLKQFSHLADRRKFDNLWNGYEEYMKAVKESAPKGLTLRDCDRYLWGKSFYTQLNHDIKCGFCRS